MTFTFAAFRKMWSDREGNALVLATLALPAGIGLCGLGLDTVQWTLAQRQLQREADSAALSGAYSKAQGGNFRTSAQASIARDNLVALSKAAVIESAPTKGKYAGNASAVRVALETSRTLPFSSFFLAHPPTIKAEATASSVTNGKYCVISLESTATAGIVMQGNADVEMGCGLATNSKATQAVTSGGSSFITASHISAVGGLRSTVNYAKGTVLLPYSVPQKDPFAALPTPVLPTCSAQLSVNPNTTVNVTNPTGTRCYRGINIKGTANFASGIYYVDGGSFSIGAQGVVTGTNVTFILTSATAATNPSSVATLDMNGGATVQLAATSTGTYKGVLFYQDRRAPNASANTVNGNALSMLQGAFYFPAQGLTFSGNSGMKTDCVQIVSRRSTFTGNSDVINECPVDSGAGAFIGTRVYLVG